MQLNLFSPVEYRISLTESQRIEAVKTIISKAQIAYQFFYSTKEVCSILHCSKDMLNLIINDYRLDVVLFKNVFRIPWYDLAAFILTDSEDTLKEDYNAYMQAITKATPQKKLAS